MDNLSEKEVDECMALLMAWFEGQEHGEQGCFNRARWAVRKLAKSVGLKTSDDFGSPTTNGQQP